MRAAGGYISSRSVTRPGDTARLPLLQRISSGSGLLLARLSRVTRQNS